MFVIDLSKCKEFVAGDKSILRELFNPLKDDLILRYSLAHAIVKPGKITVKHRLKHSEVYYILQGQGEMFIDSEVQQVKENQVIYIPPQAVQQIKNIGEKDLVFLAIVDSAWKKEDEEII